MATARSAKRVGMLHRESGHRTDEIGSFLNLIEITLVYGILRSLAFVQL